MNAPMQLTFYNSGLIILLNAAAKIDAPAEVAVMNAPAEVAVMNAPEVAVMNAPEVAEMDAPEVAEMHKNGKLPITICVTSYEYANPTLGFTFPDMTLGMLASLYGRRH